MRLVRICFLVLAGLLIQLPAFAADEAAKGAPGEDVKKVSKEFSKTYAAYNNAFARGNYPRAAEMAQKALDLAKKELGADHEKTVIMEINLAHVLIMIGKLKEAEPILLAAKQKVEKLHGADHVNLLTVHEDMAKIFASKKELDKSRRSLSRAIAIVAKASGAEHPEIARLLIQQASIDVATEKLEAAQQSYDKALSILEKTYGKNSLGTASIISLLGDLHILKKDFAKAEEYYNRTLKIYEVNLVEDDPILLGAHAKMAKIFIAMRDDRFASHADRVIKYYKDEEGKALPLFIMQPLYPVFKDGKKPQGWVLLEFDVTSTGRVEKARVMESLPGKLFDKVTLDVAKGWRFKPKVEKGKRVAQKNTRARLVFTRENIEVHMGEMKL